MRWVHLDELYDWTPCETSHALTVLDTGKTFAATFPSQFREVPDDLATQLEAALAEYRRVSDLIEEYMLGKGAQHDLGTARS